MLANLFRHTRDNYSTMLRTVVFCGGVFVFFTDHDTPCNSIHYNKFPPKQLIFTSVG